MDDEYRPRLPATIPNAGPQSGDRPSWAPAEIPLDRPSQARAHGWLLGGKDNFQVDRDLILQVCRTYPECVDVARQNRRFLYRAVRHLVLKAGITQFLDLGSGLPTAGNVHEIAQRFSPGARVVYVDSDPIVLAHGRALLADDSDTTVVAGELTEPEAILDHPDTVKLIDFDRPLGVLMFSVPHCIADDEAALRAIRGPMERAAPGSHLAISHVVADDPAGAEDVTRLVSGMGMPYRARTPDVVDAWLAGLEPVDPGLLDINDWRPDPEQPPLEPCPPELRQYLGATAGGKRMYEYGGVLRKP
jgi:hypothetical protein